MKDRDTFYKELEEKLNTTTKFPTEYLYKFIVPTDENQEQEVKDVFKNAKASITTNKSKTGKFVSVSIRLKVKSSSEVIKYYQTADKTKGIISL